MSRIMITIPDELLSEIDQMAQNEHCSRNELIRKAVRDYLKQHGQPISSSLNLAPIETIGIIERLRAQAEQRTSKARDTTEIIRCFRGMLDEMDRIE